MYEHLNLSKLSQQVVRALSPNDLRVAVAKARGNTVAQMNPGTGDDNGSEWVIVDGADNRIAAFQTEEEGWRSLAAGTLQTEIDALRVLDEMRRMQPTRPDAYLKVFLEGSVRGWSVEVWEFSESMESCDILCFSNRFEAAEIPLAVGQAYLMLKAILAESDPWGTAQTVAGEAGARR